MQDIARFDNQTHGVKLSDEIAHHHRKSTQKYHVKKSRATVETNFNYIRFSICNLGHDNWRRNIKITPLTNFYLQFVLYSTKQ